MFPAERLLILPRFSWPQSLQRWQGFKRSSWSPLLKKGVLILLFWWQRIWQKWIRFTKWEEPRPLRHLLMEQHPFPKWIRLLDQEIDMWQRPNDWSMVLWMWIWWPDRARL